jgi:hypothetical protein
MKATFKRMNGRRSDSEINKNARVYTKNWSSNCHKYAKDIKEKSLNWINMETSTGNR